MQFKFDIYGSDGSTILTVVGDNNYLKDCWNALLEPFKDHKYLIEVDGGQLIAAGTYSPSGIDFVQEYLSVQKHFAAKEV